MPILQLYEADPRGVVQRRICPLPDCSSATVRREINGEYSLTAAMPAGALYENEIIQGRAIKATVNENGDEQYFVIKSRPRSLTGGLNIYAEHQSYYYNGVILRGGGASSAGTPSLNFRQLWLNAHPNIQDLGEFTFSRSANTAKVVPAITSPTALRKLLLQWLIETHGGELIFDGFNVEWVDQMGSENGAFYRYGVNLTEMSTDEILDGYASGIFPYWGSLDPKTNIGIVTIPSWTLNFPGTFPMEVIVPVDLTDRFETQPTAAQLLTASQEYIAQNAPAASHISIKAARARIEGDTSVDLGDTVRIVNNLWGIDTKTRIQALTFDVLRGRVIDVELGTVNPGFAGAVKNMK